jgi:hypothetical protein
MSKPMRKQRTPEEDEIAWVKYSIDPKTKI